MSKSKRDRSSWNEQELDSVLSQFFQQEIPEELRNLSVPVEDSAREAPKKTSRQQTGLFSIFAVTAVLLMIVSLVWNSFQSPENSELGHSPVGVVPSLSDLGETVSGTNPLIATPSELLPGSRSSNFLFSSSTNSSEYTQFVSETVEQYETSVGAVEQRNTFYVSKKILVDPRTGIGITFTIPELQIEIQFDLDTLEVEKPSGNK